MPLVARNGAEPGSPGLFADVDGLDDLSTRSHHGQPSGGDIAGEPAGIRAAWTVARLICSPFFGQLVELGPPLRRTDAMTGKRKRHFSGLQGEGSNGRATR